MNRTSSERVWEIDFFRGIALILMIFFHIIWDLKEFYGYPFDYTQGFFYAVGRSAAYLFMLITGISCTFSKNNFKRGTKILLIAFGITIVTYFYDSKTFIAFGILHLLGVCILWYPLLKKLKPLILLFLGTIVILLGKYFYTIPMNHNFLAPLGLKTQGYYALDYYPLFPYGGVFIYGVFLAKILYSQKRSLFKKDIPNNPISFFGKHTLIIYLVHQPIIIAILYLLSNGGIL